MKSFESQHQRRSIAQSFSQPSISDDIDPDPDPDPDHEHDAVYVGSLGEFSTSKLGINFSDQNLGKEHENLFLSPTFIPSLSALSNTQTQNVNGFGIISPRNQANNNNFNGTGNQVQNLGSLNLNGAGLNRVNTFNVPENANLNIPEEVFPSPEDMDACRNLCSMHQAKGDEDNLEEENGKISIGLSPNNPYQLSSVQLMELNLKQLVRQQAKAQSKVNNRNGGEGTNIKDGAAKRKRVATMQQLDDERKIEKGLEKSKSRKKSRSSDDDINPPGNKLAEKRRRNRELAHASRERKKERITQLEEGYLKLQEQVGILTEKIKELEDENRTLKERNRLLEKFFNLKEEEKSKTGREKLNVKMGKEDTSETY